MATFHEVVAEFRKEADLKKERRSSKEGGVFFRSINGSASGREADRLLDVVIASERLTVRNRLNCHIRVTCEIGRRVAAVVFTSQGNERS